MVWSITRLMCLEYPMENGQVLVKIHTANGKALGSVKVSAEIANKLSAIKNVTVLDVVEALRQS